MPQRDLTRLAPTTPQLSKEALFRRIDALKQRLLAATVLGFAAFTGLAAHHAVGVTSRTPAANASTGQITPQSQQNQGLDDSQANQDQGSGDQSGFFSNQNQGVSFGDSGFNNSPMVSSGAS